MEIDELTLELYEKFKGLPSNNPIVRNNQIDDAFELTVLKILYEDDLGLSFDSSQIDELAKYVISPPDEGIDIFIEHTAGDESSFDVIQIKNKVLKSSEIKTAFALMERTIESFCKDATKISSESCREMLSNSNLGKSNKNNCHYYVVHKGKKAFTETKDNETVINIQNLIDLYENGVDKVKNSSFLIKGKNNFLDYNPFNDDEQHKSIVCSISGYELASLNYKFYNTKLGRNILFGQNLRESLGPKKNKTYNGIKDTIIKCPEHFWYYNNGITIIAEGVTIKEKSNGITSIILDNFSIVNGAQTTSSLGYFLQESQKNQQKDHIESLKKVFVLTRILKVKDEDMRREIAIYNNTQNPITNRDMVANRMEQKLLYNRLITGSPSIYMEIRRGSQRPSHINRKYKHRITKNEDLAQIAYSSFKLSPFTAKDKRNALFSNNYAQTEFLLNEVYHKLFNYDEENESENGVLFQKTKDEIDEALFSQYLYKISKTEKRKQLQSNIAKFENDKRQNKDINIERIQNNIDAESTMLETIGICMFYCIATYYVFKEQFDHYAQKTIFDYERFYNDKTFRDQLVSDFGNLILMRTVKILNKTARDNNKSGNVANWIRSAKCQDVFLDALSDDLRYDGDLKDKYLDFIDKYKV